MAAKLYSKEELNFFKFSTLVFDEIPKALRQIFIDMWKSKTATTWDDSAKVRNMLLNFEGAKTNIPTTKLIEEWDCTALFAATIYAKTFGAPSIKGSTLNDLYLKKMKPAPGSFHSSVQSSSGNQDETYALAIDQLRLLRNTLCHSPKKEIIKIDFDNYVQLAIDALLAVNIDTAGAHFIGQMGEDDFPTKKVKELDECRIKELQASSLFLENVVEPKLSEILTTVKHQSVGGKGNVPDTLPKPHIPSHVDLFTGREVEIEEITNLITDESTRLLSIWGTPGFGKTSTAIEVAHRLLSLGYPVYFFKFQGISKMDEILSKLLSIFKSNLAPDISLTPVDKLVSFFREISCPIFLIFDNLDDLLSSEISSAKKLARSFEDFLDSNVYINVLFTTRELLENMRDVVKGFRDVRIQPLSPVSSVEYVRQLLPPFSESILAKVAKISFHVPLAIKLVAPLLEGNSEDVVNKILEEQQFPENRLEHFESNMQKLYDTLFMQLTSSDKHALISLTVFSSGTISKDAAIEVVPGEMRVTSNAVRSLKTLVKKSLIDEDPNGNYYSIHPLILSFIVDKAKQGDFEKVLNSSRIRFCTYYLLLFEGLNDDFLAGKSVDNPHLQDMLQHLSTVMFQSITNGFDNSQHLFRILSKSEIFFFLIGIPFDGRDSIIKLYELAIEKSKTISNDLTYLKLYASHYFQNIAFSLFVSSVEFDIPKDIREKIDQLLDGTAAKLSCYEAIVDIYNGNVKTGIQRIEMNLGSLQKCTDHLLLKCLCIQVLILYYTNLNGLDKSCEFKEMVIEVCTEIGNCNLFLIGDCDFSLSESPSEDVGEALILFNYLLTKWSDRFCRDGTKRYVCNFVYKLQQQKEVEECGLHYLYTSKILLYGDFLLGLLCISAGQGTLLDERIEFLSKPFKKFQHRSSLTDSNFPSMSQKTPSFAYSPGRLLFCYGLKGFVADKKNLSIEACRNALDLSLQQYGKQHKISAKCYCNIGFAENVAENYIPALDAFDQALDIMLAVSCEPDDFDFVASVYLQKGKTYESLRKFDLAIASYEKALDSKRRTKVDQESERIAEILYLLGSLQRDPMDLTSALATLKRALQIRIKLFSEKRLPIDNVVFTYLAVARVYYKLGDDTESRKCIEHALEVLNSTDCEQECIFTKCCIYLFFLHLKVDENLYVDLLHRSLPVMKKHNTPFLPILYLTVGSKQLESGNYQAGLASLQEAVDIELDVTLLAHPDIREKTVACYLEMLATLVKIRESKLARRTLDRALQLAESLPKCTKPPWIFYCYCLEGHIHTEMQEYVLAIESLENALRKISDETFDKLPVFGCRWAIATAYTYEGRYKDALTSLYAALSIIKYVFSEGSEKEAEVYQFLAIIAQRIKNRSSVVNNLRLAYEMYSKVLGKKHSKTEESYLKYVEALNMS